MEKKSVNERIATQGFWNGAFSGQEQPMQASFEMDSRRSMGDTAARGRSFSNDFSNATTLEEKQSYARATLYDRGQNSSKAFERSSEEVRADARQMLYDNKLQSVVQNYSQSELNIPKAYDENNERGFDYNSNRYTYFDAEKNNTYGNLNTANDTFGNLYQTEKPKPENIFSNIYPEYQEYSEMNFEDSDENQMSLFDTGYVSTRYAEPVQSFVQIEDNYRKSGPSGFGTEAYNRNLVDYVEEVVETDNAKYADMTESYSRPSSRTMQYSDTSFARVDEPSKEVSRYTEKSKKISKNTMLVAVYAAIVVIIGALIISTGVLISKISRDINGLENQIAHETQLLSEQTGTLATLYNDAVIADKAEGLGMVKAGDPEKIELVELHELPVYPATSNWFDKFCDWLSNIVN